MRSPASIRLTDRFKQLPGNLRGAGWLLLSSLLFSIMALAARLLGSDDLGEPLPALQVTFFRAFATLLVVAPFLLRHGKRVLLSTRPLLASIRGCLGAGGMLCNFYGLIHLPLATAIAIQFSRPLFLLVLAAAFLSERVTGARGLTTLVGFMGVLLIVQPGPAMDPAALVVLAGALLLATSIILLRVLARTDDTVCLLFYSGVAGTLFTFIPALLTWEWPTLDQWLLIIVMCVFGVGAQSSFMKGYAAGEASAVAPFDYARLLFATLWGFLIFSELPDAWTWVGVAVLLAATWYALHLQRQEARPDNHST